MIEYTWEILSLYTAPHENGMDNVVKKVNWRFQAKEGQFYGDSYEMTELTSPNPDDYIKYDDLDEDTIVGWVKQNINYDNLVSLVNQRLDENKNPKIVEKNPPWQEPFYITGQEEYLMVVDGDMDNIYGPLKWNSKELNETLERKYNIKDVEIPINVLMVRKKLLPEKGKPAVFGDRVKIYCVSYTNTLQGMDSLYQYNNGVTWTIVDGVALGTHNIYEKPIDKVKQELKYNLTAINDRKLFETQTIFLDNESFNFVCSEEVLVKLNTIRINMSDSDTVVWKFDNAIKLLSKTDIDDVIQFVFDYIQRTKKIAYSWTVQIDNATTIEQLKALQFEYNGE